MKCVIEIPKDSHYKYEYKDNILSLDRITFLPFPQNYGFFPNTLAEDGDPLDVFVIGEQSIVPLTHVEVEIIAIALCQDRNENDHKVIAVIKGMEKEVGRYSYDLNKIRYFLRNYKKELVFDKLDNKEKAMEIIKESQERYNQTQSLRNAP